MRVVYHPAVERDVNEILRYYEGVSSDLADEFWNELLGSSSKSVRTPIFRILLTGDFAG